MSLKVIGAGFGRTGTMSLKHALEQLGVGPCYHMLEVGSRPEHAVEWARAHAGEAIDWDALFDGFQSTVDWPSCNWWREQRAAFPDAKILLSLRDGEGWYESVMNTIHATTVASLASDDEGVRRRGEWANEIIWKRVFDGRMDDRAHVIGCFDAHNEEVMRSVPADELLVYRPGDGWEPLCAFLDLPVPETPYPHTNTTAEFQERMGAGS